MATVFQEEHRTDPFATVYVQLVGWDGSPTDLCCPIEDGGTAVPPYGLTASSRTRGEDVR